MMGMICCSLKKSKKERDHNKEKEQTIDNLNDNAREVIRVYRQTKIVRKINKVNKEVVQGFESQFKLIGLGELQIPISGKNINVEIREKSMKDVEQNDHSENLVVEKNSDGNILKLY